MNAPASALIKHELLNKETQEWLLSILESDIAPFLQPDISSYAPGRMRTWMPYKAPLDTPKNMNTPFQPGVLHDELWQWIVDLCHKYGMKAQTCLISKGGNINPHRDTTYAAEWAMGINLGACNWHIASDRDSAKTDYSMALNGGEVFSFNTKHVHAVTNAAPDRWAINVWAIASTKRAKKAQVHERLESMLNSNEHVRKFIDLHQPGAKKEEVMATKPLYKVAFTGHRPNKIGGYDPTAPMRVAVTEAIKNSLERAVAKYGHTHEVVVISGGALGVDTDAAREAYKMGLRFIVAAPCRNQDKGGGWSPDQRSSYAKMCAAASAELAKTLAGNGETVKEGVVYVHDGEYNYTCMQDRNVWMVDHADAVVAIWNGSSGGTANCVNYAKKVGRPMIIINPDDLNGGGGNGLKPTPNKPQGGGTVKIVKQKNADESLPTMKVGDFTLNGEQTLAYNAIVNGNDNILLTGNAGTGKSFLMNLVIKALHKKNGSMPIVCATTGIAATHIDGRTVHSALGFGISYNFRSDVEKVGRKMAQIKNAKVVIIDEVSMMHPDFVDHIDNVFKTVFGNKNPFGGIRFVFVGDFMQLPPVDKQRSLPPLAFDAQAWKNGSIKTIQLLKVVRQQDSKFANFLSNIRQAIWTPATNAVVQSRIGLTPENEPIALFATNKGADEINRQRLEEIPSEMFTFVAIDKNPSWTDRATGQVMEQTDYWDKNCLAPKVLDLKVGQRVISLMNANPNEAFLMTVNGDLGTVTELDFSDPYFPRVYVLWDRFGQESQVELFEFTQDEHSRLSRTQLPLKSAYALTIHKSQGMTLSSARLSLDNSFAEGQMYVALSRIRTLEGVFIESFDERKLKASEKALQFYGLPGNLIGDDAIAASYMNEDGDDGEDPDPVDQPGPNPDGNGDNSGALLPNDPASILANGLEVDENFIYEEEQPVITDEEEVKKMTAEDFKVEAVNNVMNIDYSEDNLSNSNIVTYVYEPQLISVSKKGKTVDKPVGQDDAKNNLAIAITNNLQGSMKVPYFESVSSKMSRPYARTKDNVWFLYALQLGHGWHYPFLEDLDRHGVKFQIRIIPMDLAKLEYDASANVAWMHRFSASGTLAWTSANSVYIMDIYDDHGNVIRTKDFDWSLIGAEVIDSKKLVKRLAEITRCVKHSTRRKPNVLVHDPDKLHPADFAHLSNPVTPFDGISVVRRGYLPKGIQKEQRIMIRGMIEVEIPSYINDKSSAKKWMLLKGDAVVMEDGMPCDVVDDYKMPRDPNGKPYDIITHSENLKGEFVLISTGKWANRKPIVSVWPHHDVYPKVWEQQAPNNFPMFLPVEDMKSDLNAMIAKIEEDMKNGILPENLTLPEELSEDEVYDDSSMLTKLTSQYSQALATRNVARSLMAKGISPKSFSKLVYMHINSIINRMKSGYDNVAYFDSMGKYPNPMFGMHKKHPVAMRNAVIVACSTREFFQYMAGYDWAVEEGTHFYVEGFGHIWPADRFDQTFLLHGGDDHDDNHTIKPIKLWSKDPAFVDQLANAGVFAKGTVLPSTEEEAVVMALTLRSPNGAGEYSINKFDFDTWPKNMSEIDWSLVRTFEVAASNFPIPLTTMLSSMSLPGLTSGRSYTKKSYTRKNFQYDCSAQMVNPGFGTMCNVMATYSHTTGGRIPASVPAMLGDIVDATQQGADWHEFTQIANMPMQVAGDIDHDALTNQKMRTMDFYVWARRAQSLVEHTDFITVDGPMTKYDRDFKAAYEHLKERLDKDWWYGMRNREYLTTVIRGYKPNPQILDDVRNFWNTYTNMLDGLQGVTTGFERKATNTVHLAIMREQRFLIMDQAFAYIDSYADKQEFLLTLYHAIVTPDVMRTGAKHGVDDRLLLQLGRDKAIIHMLVEVLEERHIAGLFDNDYDAIVFSNQSMDNGVIKSLDVIVPELDLDFKARPNEMLARLVKNNLVPEGTRFAWFIKDGAPKALFIKEMIWKQYCNKLPDSASYS